MSSNYCTCWGNEGSCIDCAEAEIDRLKEENEKLSSRMVNWPNLFDENMMLKTRIAELEQALERIAHCSPWHDEVHAKILVDVAKTALGRR